MTWEHDELAHDLANTRRNVGEIVAERLGLGSWGGREQLDVAAMRPSWSNPRPTAYEIKVTRSDFLSDVRSEKYARYLPFVSRLYYATPAGLVKPSEIPPGVGLVVRGPNGWYARRAARNHPVTGPGRQQTFLMAMLFKDHPASWKTAGRAERVRLAAVADLSELRRKGMERVRRAVAAERDLQRLRVAVEEAEEVLREALPEKRWMSLVGLARSVVGELQQGGVG